MFAYQLLYSIVYPPDGICISWNVGIDVEPGSFFKIIHLLGRCKQYYACTSINLFDIGDDMIGHLEVFLRFMQADDNNLAEIPVLFVPEVPEKLFPVVRYQNDIL